METLIRLIKLKKFRKAETLLREDLHKSPNDVYVLTQLANVLWNRYKDEEALSFADKAKMLSPVYPLLNYTRGRILWSLEKFEQSNEEWNVILNMPEEEIAQRGYGLKWAKSIINYSRYYKADCLYHLFKDKEALELMEAHLEHRRKGQESDFSKKEAILFYKVLKYSHFPKNTSVTELGYASATQKSRIMKKVDVLEEKKDWKRLISYLKKKVVIFPKEYYLKTIISEYCIAAGKTADSLNYAKEAFAQEPNDPLVKYNYAVALMKNKQTDEALEQFDEIIAWGVDYIAYSEHGEGIKWAKKLLRDTQKYLLKIRTGL